MTTQGTVDQDDIDLAAAASNLRSQFGGHWGQHPVYAVEIWLGEVANTDTRLGYWEWVANQIEIDGDQL